MILANSHKCKLANLGYTLCQLIFKKHGVYYHKYADDIQLYVIFDPAIPGDRERAIARMEACVKDIREWMAPWWLKLNDDKTEMLIKTSLETVRCMSHYYW